MNRRVSLSTLLGLGLILLLALGMSSAIHSYGTDSGGTPVKTPTLEGE